MELAVIGRYPNYLEKAEQIGARRFSIPERIWNAMTEDSRWEANLKFLQRLVRDNCQVIAQAGQASGYYKKELEYLKTQVLTVNYIRF